MRNSLLCLLALMVAACVATPQAHAADGYDPQHADWTGLLKAHVSWSGDGHASTVDYAGFAKDRAALKGYLDQLAGVSQPTFDGWKRDEREAFLINAYNAWTVELILTKYPDLESIRDLGGIFSSAWKQSIATLLGKKRTLDDIEHGLLRGAPGFNEPRIHFAVNCASIGCPALRPEAYTAARYDEQLEDQTQRFLSDRSRNRYSSESDELELSSLFKWYADDFKHSGSKLDAPASFIAHYADQFSDDAAVQQRIRADDIEHEFLDYDWALNDVASR
jgi:hypothetical protein